MSVPSLDRQQAAYVQRIVQEVIRRLAISATRHGAGSIAPAAADTSTTAKRKRFSSSTPVSVRTADKLITADTINQLPAGTGQLVVPPRAVITPLAKDDARDRGIRLIRDPEIKGVPQ